MARLLLLPPVRRFPSKKTYFNIRVNSYIVINNNFVLDISILELVRGKFQFPDVLLLCGHFLSRTINQSSNKKLIM